MPAPLDWAEVESSPWFNALTPSEKSATHLEWRDTVLSEQEDLDDDTKIKLLALSESRAKTLAGQPQDPEPLKSFYAEREKKNAKISQGYEAFTNGEIQDDPEFAALDEAFKGRRDAAMVRGNLFINPALVLDKDKYEAAVRASDAPMSEKTLALTQFKDRNEQASENLANTLSYTDEEFRTFAGEGYNQGKTNSQIVNEWKAKQKLPDGIFGSIMGAGRQAKLGFSGGLSGLERAVGGIGMALGVGGEQYAAESGQEAASYAARREMAGGAPIIGEVAEGATSLIPTLAVGAVGAALSPTPAAPAAAPIALAAGAAARATLSRALTSLTAGAVTGGLQSAGSTVADAFEMYKVRGDTDADAIGQARVDGAVSGIITGAVTGLFGTLGQKYLGGGGIETLFQRRGSEALAVAGEKAVKNAFVTATKSVLGNATEEAIEEGTDQFIQGLYEAATRNPNKDFRSILEETAHAAKIGAILGGGMQTIKEGLTFKSMVETAKGDPSLGDPTLDAANKILGIEAKQLGEDANAALEATVNADPAVQGAVNAANMVGAAAVNAADNNAPATAAQLAQIKAQADELAKNRADEVRTQVGTQVAALEGQLSGLYDLGEVDADADLMRGIPPVVAQQLQAVANNTATPEQVASLTEQGLTRVVDGQPVITDAGLSMLPPENRPRLSEDERVAEIEATPTPQTASGKRVGDAINPGENISVVSEKDTSSPSMPTEYTVLEVESVANPKKNEVHAKRRDMTPNEVARTQQKMRERNQVAAEMGMPQEDIPEAPAQAAPAPDQGEVDLFGQPIAAEKPTTSYVDGLETVELPVGEITLSRDVPQFKSDADARGVVEPLAGKYQRLGTGPILVWERLDGRKEVISGRHRFDLAKRTGEKTIPAQVVREADGFNQQLAMTADAELNIRDGQGKVKDYANYFRNAEIDEGEADARGLRARAAGRAGWVIGTQASKEVADLHANGKLSDAAAEAIARTAPNNEALQRVGARSVLDGQPIDVSVNLMQVMQAELGSAGTPEQLDLFGSDDSTMEAMRAQAKRAAMIQRDLREQVAAVKGASKRPEKAKAMGVDVKDPEAVRRKVYELELELDRWGSWPLHEDLRAQVRGQQTNLPEEVGSPTTEVKTPAVTTVPPAPISPAPTGVEPTPASLPATDETLTPGGVGTPPAEEGELFDVESTKGERPKVRGETDKAQVPQEDLLGELEQAKAKGEAERAQTKIDLEQEQPATPPPPPTDELVPEQRDEPPAVEPETAAAAEPVAAAEEVSAPVEEGVREGVSTTPTTEPASDVPVQGGAAGRVAPAAKPAQVMDSAKAERKAKYDAKRAELAKKAEKLSKELGTAADVLNRVRATKTSIPFLDPEVFAALRDVATSASKLGIVKFEEFAALVKYKFPEFWGDLKEILSAVWNAATRADRTLRETPSNAEVDRIFADLEEFDDMDTGVDTTVDTPVDTRAEEDKKVDTGKTISEDEAAAEGAADTFIPPSEGQGPPKEADLLQNVGFGKFRDVGVRDATLRDPQFMFGALFDDTAMAQTLAGKNAQRLRDVRNVVSRMNGYREYQRVMNMSPEEVAAENAKLADELDQTVADLRSKDFFVDVRPDGLISIRLKPEQKEKYEDIIRSNSILWSNQLAAFVSGFSSDVIAFGRDVSDRLAGRPVAYERAASQTEARITADKLRAELAQADDESILDAKEVDASVNQATRKKLYAGVDMGIPLEIYNEQVYDAALIGKAHKDKKPMFLLASQPGSGKTFVLGASIERMKKQGAKKIVYVTRNQELIGQIKNDLNAYDIDGVQFMTYAALDDAVKNPAEDTDVIIFDEAHEVRYSVSGDASKRAIKAGEWMNKSKFTVLASATPYEDLEQMRYLWAAGAFQPFAREDLRGNAEKGWYGFAEVLGGEVRLKDGEPTGVKFPEDTAKLREMRFASREYLRKRGMFSQRKLRIPAEMIRSFFPAVAAKPEWVTMFDATVEALAGIKGANNNLKAFVTNLQKRILEASKQEAAVKLARQKVAAGKRTVIFVETRSENERDLPEIVAAYQAWVESGRDPETKPDIVPDIPNIDKFFEKLIELGIDEIKFPSAQDYFKETLGDLGVVFYTGNESGKQGETSLSKWNSGEAPVMVATMARGGTGLSLHDKLGVDNGGAERAQIMLNLPWRASEVEQVAGRTARYGMKSVTEIYWLFTKDIEFDRKLAQKVGNRMASMNVLVQGDITPSATTVVNYDLQTAEDIDKNTEDRDQVGDELTAEQAATMANLNTSTMSIVYTEEDNAYLKVVEANKITQKTPMAAWEGKAKNRATVALLRTMLINAGLKPDANLVAWDDDGNVIAPSVRAQAEKGVMMSMAPTQDAEYLAAVEAGDMETAQRMVDEAARAAGGPPMGHVYAPKGAPEYIPTTDIIKWAKSVKSFRANRFISEDADAMNQAVAIEESARVLAEEWADDRGGFIQYDPESAELQSPLPPITRDDSGNVIPLSQRFQPSSPDIRQSAPSLSPVYGLVKRKLTIKDKLHVKEAFRILRKAIPQIDSLVIVDSLENLLKRTDLTQDEKDTLKGPNFAQGIFSNGRAFVAYNNVIRTDLHASEAAAIAGVMVHELMHKGSAIMRLSPDLAPVYANWKSMLDEYVSNADIERLVLTSHPGYANWKNNTALRESAQEEVFVKRIEALFHKGNLLEDAEKTLMQKFLSLIKALVNKLLGNNMSKSDEVVARWARFFVVATANRHMNLNGRVEIGVMASFARTPQGIRHAELEAKYNDGTITPEETAEAQALVDEAAKAAGYTVGPVFHRTKADFTVFDLDKSSPGAVWGPAIYASLGSGSWNPASLTDSKVIKGYVGGNVIDLTQPSASDLQVIGNLIGREIDTIPLITLERRYGSVAEGLKAAGFSAALHKGPGSTGNHIAVFDPNQIKSADPFTGVPLDSRFDSTSSDIRASMAPGESPRDGDVPRPASLFSTYLTEEDAASVVAQLGKMDDTMRTFAREQVLGERGRGMVYQVQPLGPQQTFAMDYIGFSEDPETGLPEVNPRATAKAKALAVELLSDPTFAMRYQTEVSRGLGGPSMDAAGAVLQLELTRYAIALMAKGDVSLQSIISRNWNNIIMGKYLTMAAAGRLLQARSHYTGTVQKTIAEMDKAMYDAAIRTLTKLGEENPTQALEDFENAVTNAQPDYSALFDALGKGPGIPKPKNSQDMSWLEAARESLSAHKKNTLDAILYKLRRIAFLKDAQSRMKAPGVQASMPDYSSGLDNLDVPTDPAAMEALLAKEMDELGQLMEDFNQDGDGTTDIGGITSGITGDTGKPAPKPKPKPKPKPPEPDAPGVLTPQDQTEITDAVDEVESLEEEGDNKTTLAAIAKQEELITALAKKYSPTKPSESVLAKISQIVRKHIRNIDNEQSYVGFRDSMITDFTEELDEEIREEIQDLLIEATWKTHIKAPQVTAEKMLAAMQSVKGIKYGQPDKAKAVKDAIRSAIVNADELTELVMVKRLTDTLVSLTVSKEVAEEVAQEAYGQSVRYAAQKLQARIRRITESLVSGGNKRLLAALAKANPDSVSDPTWQHSAVRSVFQASGLSFDNADTAARGLTSQFSSIFDNSGIRLAKDAKTRLDDAVTSLIDRWAELQSDTPSLRASKARQLKITDLFRQQVRLPVSEDEFTNQVAAFGATRTQAMVLFNQAATEHRYKTARGLNVTNLGELMKFIKSMPQDLLNSAGTRKDAIRAFLKSNGFTPEQIRITEPYISNNLEKYLQQARNASLERILSQRAAYRKAMEAKEDSLTTQADRELKRTLQMIRSGIAEGNSVAEAFAKSEKFEAFLETDRITLARLDNRITAAEATGRTHDAALAIKELFELLNRRRMPMTLLERLAIAYNNSALSSISTLGINLYGPVGSIMTRVGLDMTRAMASRDWNSISLIFSSLADTFSQTYAEGALAVRGDAYTNAMQRAILKVTNLRVGADKALATLKNKKASPWDRTKALGVVVQSYTDIVRRILSTADQAWFTTMQGYFLKLQASKALMKSDMSLAEAQAAVFNVTETTRLKVASDKNRIAQYSERVNQLRGKSAEEIRAGIEAIIKDESALEGNPLGLNDEVLKYNRTLDNELRSIIRSASLPFKDRGDLLVDKVLKELKTQMLAVDLRRRDLVARDIYNILEKRISPEEAKRVFQFAEKESEYEIGNHRGEKGATFDLFNQFSMMIQDAGQSVLQKNPILGRMLLGYFGVPVNLLNRSLWYTPYGLLRYAMAKRLDKDPLTKGQFYQQSMISAEQMKQRLSEALLGTSVFAFAIALQALGDDDEEELFNVTLAGPTNKTEYDAWVKNGHRKGAIEMNIDGKVYSLNWARGLFEPWKPAFVAMGAFDDMKLNRKLGDRENEVAVVNYLAAAIAGWNQQASFFGAKSTLGATFGTTPDTNVIGTLAYKASPVLPFSGFLNSVSKFYTGPNTYRGREGAIWANIPIVSMFATNRAVNALGDPVGVTGDPIAVANDRAWYAGMPLNVGGKMSGNDAKVYEFILERGTGPGIPQRSAIETKNGFITDAEFLDYVAFRGRIVKSQMLRDLPKLRAMDDDSLSKAMGEISTKATRDAKKRFRYE